MNRYINTWNPKLFCPECNTQLKITKLQHKLWCEDCYEYVEENKLTEKFVVGIE